MKEETMLPNDLVAALARLEERGRHAEALAEKAEEDRKHMMQQLNRLTAGQERLALDMLQVKPVTDMITSARSKLAGALLVLGFIGALLWTGITFFKEALLKYILGSIG